MENYPLRKPHNIIIGSLICLISYLAIALIATTVKLIPPTIHMGVIIFFQYSIALLLCLPGLFKAGLSKLKTEHPKLHLLRDAAGILNFAAFFLSLAFIPLVNAVVLRSTTPFWIPIILLLWRGDRFSAKLWGSIIVGFIGVFLIAHPPGGAYFNSGSLLALASGALMAVAALSIRQLAATDAAQSTMFYYFLIACLCSLPFAIAFWTPLSLHDLLLLIAVGVLMYIVQFTMILAFRYAKPSVLAPISYSAIIFAGILGWLFWGQIPHSREYLGMLLIICAGLAVILLERKKELATHSSITDQGS